MTTEELKYIEIPENNKRYEVAVTQEALNDKLVDYGSAIVKTASGDIATITDGADDVPMKSVKVNIEPIQDLHGQSYPYPEGGGKNLLDPSTITKYANTSMKFYVGSGILLKSGVTYTLSYKGSVALDGLYVKGASGTPTHFYVYNANTLTFTPTEDIYASFDFYEANGLSNIDDLSNYQLEKGSTATEYAPYSNICPISGWDEVEVVRCGKNVLYLPTLAEFEASPKVSNYYSYAIKVKPNTSYYLSVSYTDGYDPSGKYTYVLLTNNPSGNNPWVALAHHSNPLGGAITSSADGYLYLRMNDAEIAHNNYPNIRSHAHAQLEEGSTATAYEPYQGTSYPIPLPSTVYGGTLKIIKGETVAVLDHKVVTFDGSSDEGLSWTYNQIRANISDANINGIPSAQLKCNRLKPLDYRGGDFSSPTFSLGTYTSPNDKTFVFFIGTGATTLAEGKTWLASNPVEVWYPLAEPITITLDPITPINTLLGSNNIWSDAGTVEVEYRADSTLVYNELVSLIANM